MKLKIANNRKQLQRFLGSLNYVSDFFPHLRQICAPLYNRLRKNLKPWSSQHTQIIQQVKQKLQSLPCLGIPHPDAFMIVETDASDIGCGGILKQRIGTQNEQLVLILGYGMIRSKNIRQSKKKF